jgi:hypothetical protein
MFNCRSLSTELRVLTKDYTVDCDTATHKLYEIVAGAVTTVFSLGVPLVLVVLMVQRMREYISSDETDRFVARHVADELQLDDKIAADAIRDVMMRREYSFLVNAYKPRYYFWEGYDMIRKLLLVGMLIVAGVHTNDSTDSCASCKPYTISSYHGARAGQGSSAQLFVGLCISVACLAAQIRCEPYKHDEDNWFKTATEIQILLTLVVALILKSITAASEERLPKQFYDICLTCTFLLHIPVYFIFTLWQKRLQMNRVLRYSGSDDSSGAVKQQALQMLQLGISSDADVELLSSYFDRVRASVDKNWHAFISYRVQHEADVARELFDRLSALELRETGQRVRVYLDQVRLEDGRRWDTGFMEGLAETVVFVPLVSVGCVRGMKELTPEEDWCDNVLLEWCAALELHERGRIKAILPMLIGEPDFFAEAEAAFGGLQGLPQHMSSATMEAVETHLTATTMGGSTDGLLRLVSNATNDSPLSVQSVVRTLLKFQGVKVCTASGAASAHERAAAARHKQRRTALLELESDELADIACDTGGTGAPRII